MTPHFADQLINACESKGSAVCVGLDPVLERLPAQVGGGEPTQRMHRFCLGVLDAVVEHTAVVKVQAACFERYGSQGWAVLERVIEAAKARGLLVILDAKRGDVGHSAEHYAAGLLENLNVNAITVNPYLGMDTLEPFVATAMQQKKGVFVLVRTSNPGSGSIQGLELSDGRTVVDAVAEAVAALGQSDVGSSGYGSIGAVVGATHPADSQRLRQSMPNQLFLVPGFGAQGGRAEHLHPCFHANGTGAVINVSRSVIYAYEDSHEGWPDAITSAAKRVRDQVNQVRGKGPRA